MAQLTINIPDAVAPRLRDSFCAATGYEAQVPNPNFDPGQPVGPGNPDTIPNPVSKMEWVKKQIIEWVRHQVLTAELGQLDAQHRTERNAEKDSISSAMNLT